MSPSIFLPFLAMMVYGPSSKAIRVSSSPLGLTNSFVLQVISCTFTHRVDMDS